MNTNVFVITHPDPEMRERIAKTDHKTLAVWAIECAKRVLPYFVKTYPEDGTSRAESSDHRPRTALETLQKWLDDGIFTMAVIRKASLDAHAAARDVGEDSPARSAARACGQAVATAHVPFHSYGAAIYAQQAVFRAHPADPETAATKERDWQFERLCQY